MNQLPSDVETNRNSDKKKKMELDRTHTCKDAGVTGKKCIRLESLGIYKKM